MNRYYTWKVLRDGLLEDPPEVGELGSDSFCRLDGEYRTEQSAEVYLEKYLNMSEWYERPSQFVLIKVYEEED